MANIHEVTTNEFKKEVLESDIPVLVDFWAPWCGPCRMVAPVVEGIAQKMDGKFKFVKLNTDQNQETAMEYGIMAIPSLVVFKGGSEVHRVVGFMPQEQLESELSQFLSPS